MPFYKDLVIANKIETALDKLKKEERARIIKGILKLRERLEAEIPTRTINESLLLASWNIREFAPKNKGGERLLDSYFYIAEIVSRFDLIAIQEVRDDIRGLQQVQRILGSDWQYIFTDVSAFADGGNSERMAFLFDTRKVKLSGLSGEIQLPKSDITFARTPFMVGFKSGWTDFVLTTVHIYYGESTPVDARRLAEIEKVSNFLKKLSEDENAITNNWILLGDFNIFNIKDKTFEALTKAGFEIHKKLQKIPGSNVLKTKHYDQIAFKVDKLKFQTKDQAGIFDFFETVFTESDESLYSSYIPSAYKSKYKEWRTFQMSDHLPMWVNIKIDYSDDYLKNKLAENFAGL
jgi:endonuclease/exonuclease/phosphatase family metal-dependent hydrolase